MVGKKRVRPMGGGKNKGVSQLPDEWVMLLQHIPDMVFIHRAGKIIFANQVAADLMGIERDELIGGTVLDYVHPAFRETVTKNIRRRLQGEIIDDYEIDVMGKRGILRVMVRAEILRIAGTVFIVTVLHDMSRIYELEKELIRERTFLENVIEYNSYAYRIFDGEGNFLWDNKASRLLFSQGEEPADNLFEDKLLTAHGLQDNRQRLLAGETVQFPEMCAECFPQSGERRIISATLFSLKEGEDQIQAIVAVYDDVTQRKQMETALLESQANYRFLVEAAPDAVVLTDLDGYLTMVNPTAQLLYGSDHSDDMIGRSVTDFIAPEDRQLVKESLQALVRDKDRSHKGYQEYVFLRRDGTQLFGEVKAALIRDGIGNPKGITMFMRDISERKRSEESMLFTQFAVDNVSDTIFWIKAETAEILYCNKAAQKNLGYSLEEITHMRVPDIDPLFPTETWPEHVKKMESNRSMTFESLHRRKDGTIYPVEVNGNYLWYKGVLYSCTVIRDITLRKEAEAALQRSYEELEQKVEERTQELTAMNEELHSINDELLYANRALENEIQERRRVEKQLAEANGELSMTLERLQKTQDQLVEAEKMASLGNLVAGVAHQINTPVGVGITAVSHLEEVTKELAAQYRKGRLTRVDMEKYLEDAASATELLTSILDRVSKLISSFKQVSAKREPEVMRSLYMKTYLEEILFGLRPSCERAGVRVVLDCEDELQMETYPGAVFQVISQLVSNSLLHGYGDTSGGGEISIRIRQDGEGVKLRYSDDGHGMTEEVRRNIFEPFFTTRRHGGSHGLGLAIVYNVVTQRLGGTIECESSPGKGSVFLIRLPAVSPENIGHLQESDN